MSERLRYLFNSFFCSTCTGRERMELMGLALEEQHQEQIKKMIAEKGEQSREEDEMDEEKAESIFQFIIQGNSEAIIIDGNNKFNWKKLVVAATILISIFTAGYFILNNKGVTKPIARGREDIIAPTTNRAMISLSDGRTMYLDSAANGELVHLGNIKIIKLANGQIKYESTKLEAQSLQPQLNRLTNPRGSKVIDLTLADGSKVWLNAGSSITYPIAFTGTERKIMITGEAYFEVAHNSAMPFKVAKDEMEIKVIGTHFNVNAYDDEQNFKVTLLEGSVKVTHLRTQDSKLIKSGQQVVLTHNSELTTYNSPNLEEVMAWKNGYLKFNNTDLKVIMREIGRWYDVDIIYQGSVPVQLYNVGVPRTANVSEVLSGLEYTGANFKIEGKKITVRP